MEARDFEAAGLYDPSAPNAADRLALLEWLAERGVSLAQMEEAAREGLLWTLAGRTQGGLRPSISVAEVATRAGLSVEDVERFRQAAGLPPVARDVPVFHEADVEVLQEFARSVAVVGETLVARVLRVAGSGIASTAEAMLTDFRGLVEAPMRQGGAPELALAHRIRDASAAMEAFPKMLAALFRLHVDEVFTRFRYLGRGIPADRMPLAVAFVDLVGFTPLSLTLPADRLLELVERFTETARDAVVARRGRLVKLIGDEVMLVASDAAAGCDAALALVEQFAGDDIVRPRAGVASGSVLVHGGDYFGPVVNLAARLVDLAVPGEVLVTESVAAEGSGAIRFVPAGRRMVRGLTEPVSVLSAERLRSTG